MTTGRGCSSEIIREALSLGILCRPVTSHRLGVGTALETSKCMFWMVTGHDSQRTPFSPTPEELTEDWQLTTWDLIRAEWMAESEVAW